MEQEIVDDRRWCLNARYDRRTFELRLVGRLRDRESGEWGFVEAQPVTWKKAEIYAVDNGPPLRWMSPDDCQMLVEELWKCGFRPTEVMQATGSLAATERHLEDLRKLVFEGK